MIDPPPPAAFARILDLGADAPPAVASPRPPASPPVDWSSMRPAAPPSVAATPPPPQAPAAPTMWRLADSTGQAWEHADPDHLRRFVEARNRALAAPAPTYYAPAYRAAPSPCASGRCPRR